MWRIEMGGGIALDKLLPWMSFRENLCNKINLSKLSFKDRTKDKIGNHFSFKETLTWFESLQLIQFFCNLYQSQSDISYMH